MIWVMGAGGMLGRELVEALALHGIPALGTGHEVPIQDAAALEAFSKGKVFSWIVNCAAYTDVDRAEDERGACEEVNAEGPRLVGALAQRFGARVVQVSTDYVFDGKATRPYREDDPVSPLGVYGRTKAEGEARLMAEASDSVIVRTAWLYGRHGHSFVSTMLGLMAGREELSVVEDQVGSPTWARDLAEAIISIIVAESIPAGIYHFAGGGQASRIEFARAIERLARGAGLLRRPCRLLPARAADFPARACRPSFSALSTEKIRSCLGLSIPDWQTSLSRHIGELARERA